ncbi:MAG TPA: methyl-accepting chemotaxis protein [Dissulfurispiraceae bacterium]
MVLKNMKIGSRLNLAFAIILFLILVLIVSSIYGFRSFIYDSKGIELASDVRDQMQKIDRALISMLLINDENTRKEQKQAYDREKTEFRRTLGSLEKAIGGGELKNDVADLKKRMTDIEKANDQIVDYCFSDMLEIGMNTFLANKANGEKVLKTSDKIVASYEKKVDALAQQTQVFLLVVGGVALILGIIISTVLKRSIVRPLNKGIEVANRLAEGDLTLRVDVDGKDEVNYLLSAMGGTVEKLHGIMGNIKEAASSITAAVVQLKTHSDEITKGMDLQSSRASQIATSTEEMSQTVIDVAKNASNIADSSKDTAKLAQTGSEIVDKSVQEVREIAGTVNSATEMIGTLSERSKQIGEIVSVINDIADQTNLLALNAAIEAARAGEMGRGFAVVADEVRKLAERTAKATLEISEMIQAIQREVDATVESMGGVRKRMDHGVELSSQAGEELKEIVTSIGGLQAMVQQIASSTEEMSATAELISRDIEGVATNAKDINSGSGQITQSVNGLSDLALRLKQVVDMFKI